MPRRVGAENKVEADLEVVRSTIDGNEGNFCVSMGNTSRTATRGSSSGQVRRAMACFDHEDRPESWDGVVAH
jgi:hypothetical protein